jgi:hypothetical protein
MGRRYGVFSYIKLTITVEFTAMPTGLQEQLVLEFPLNGPKI